MLRQILSSVLLAIFAVGQGFGQSLMGIVRDAESGEVLTGANVYLARTTKGASTDLEGRFELTGISSGQQDLIIRFVGYEPKTLAFTWPTPDPLIINLVPRTEELETVTVSASRDWGWKMRFRLFEEAILGSTPSATKCHFVNPELVEVSAENGVLLASASEPILIENQALGYKIELALQHFEQEGDRLSYAGLPRFENLTPENDRQRRRWEKARERAYRGSMQHFLKALATKRLDAEGFEVYAVTWDQLTESWRPLRRMDWNSLCEVSGKGDLLLNSYYSWRVVYTEEPFPEMSVGGTQIPKRPYQTSYLHFQSNEIILSPDGKLYRPELVTEQGYWFFERLAELMPEEYSLASLNTQIIENEQAVSKNGFKLTNSLIPISEIYQGGPPRDGIPALTSPDMFSVSQATYLKSDDYVLGLNYNGEAKAYPIRIMNYHEVVNDRFGDKAVVITYCPLCGSGIGFSREVNEETLSFGVSGLLYQSDVLLYDKQTESLWSQLEMKAISGSESGTPLKPIALELTTWKDWKTQHPNTVVLADDHGFGRDYTQTPYEGYSESNELFFPVQNESHELARKERVLGVQVGNLTTAYAYRDLAKLSQPLKQTLGEYEFTITYHPESQSVTVEAPEEVSYLSLYWFAWHTFHPESSIWKP
ncbi:MAG TPA: hypothetical protein DCE41_30425 [Cytophagales bacterium]|nr:hypothetical protein [Cytophagales bacterium]HAA19120.1 hypothetical protein [Cytophagales bacterium]HAP62721.1 hypothetical protein [Cytophagales bacterium]